MFNPVNDEWLLMLHRNQSAHVSEIKPQECEISSCYGHSSVTAEYTVFPPMEVCHSSVVTGNVSITSTRMKKYIFCWTCASFVSKFCPHFVCKCQSVLSDSIDANLREKERER